MKRALCFMLLVLSTTIANGRDGFPQYHSPHDPAFEEWAMQAVRPVIEENFAAVNAEDVDRLMATHTSYCPDREAFKKEAAQAFEDFDVYVRLVDLRWGGGSNASTGYKTGHQVAVIVTQQTLPANEDAGDYTSYRGNSALLPASELVYYTLHCHMEKGKWKIHMINGHVNETTWEYFEGEQKERERLGISRSPTPEGRSPFDCANGRCEQPVIRVGR